MLSLQPEKTRRVIDCYRHAILIHCKPGVDVKQLVVTLEREVFLAGYYKALALGCGPCSLCDECNLRSCIHPEQARPAMEACGVDVFATARANGFAIHVVTDHLCDQNCCGVVLVDQAHNVSLRIGIPVGLGTTSRHETPRVSYS